jgi:hypothetical protein
MIKLHLSSINYENYQCTTKQSWKKWEMSLKNRKIEKHSSKIRLGNAHYRFKTKYS